jgi:hypothetical protein
MLKVEEAKAPIDEWRLPEDEDRIDRQLDDLPQNLREFAKRIFWHWREEDRAEAALDGGYERNNRRRRAATIEVDRLPVGERAKIFSLISPALAPHMEATWQLLKTTPYQAGYQRKAFRAPKNPELMAEALSDWTVGMASLGKAIRPEVLTPAWLAAWTPHLTKDYSGFEAEVGPLLAAVLNQKTMEADEVFEILLDSLHGQHEIGRTGRHVYHSFLLSNRPAAWEAMEKTLLAAQRQEGLRQAILELIDFAHPDAFRRMLRLVLEHDLLRFSAVVRGVDVWFGELWAAASAGIIKKMLQQIVEFLDNPSARARALQGKDAEAAFLALWCTATEDAIESIEQARQLLGAESAELRYVAARHLANLQLSTAQSALSPALDDADLRVAAIAVAQSRYSGELDEGTDGLADDRFERAERLIPRVSDKPQKLQPIVWPWTEHTLKRSDVAACLLGLRGKRHATRLIPHLDVMDTHHRRAAASVLVELSPWDDATRTAVVELAGDASPDTREVALAALEKQSLPVSDIQRLESYLTRKSGDLRRGVLAILLKQSDEAALASAARLLAAKDANQRLAGLELLRLLAAAKRAVDQCRAQATAYEQARKKITKDERAHLDDIATDKAAVATLDDALGLMNPAGRTPVVPPRNLKTPYVTPAAIACLKSLDDLVHEHRETPMPSSTHGGAEQELLGNIGWRFPSPTVRRQRENEAKNLPLAEIWHKWYDRRGRELRDPDGLELVRAYFWSNYGRDWKGSQWSGWANSSTERKACADFLAGGAEPLSLRYDNVVSDVVRWLLYLHPADARDYLLDALETAFALVPATDMARLGELSKSDGERRSLWSRSMADMDWRDVPCFDDWLDNFAWLETATGFTPTAEHECRLWRLLHWRGEPFVGARRRRAPYTLTMVAYTHGAANLADIADQLLGPRGSGEYQDESFDMLEAVTARKPEKEVVAWLNGSPEVRNLVEQATARILDLELHRGDAPTAATIPAYALKSLAGIETLRRVLHALGKSEFKITSYWRSTGGLDRRQTLTHLAKVTHPAEGETPADFVAAMKRAVAEGQFPEERLLQLLFLSPQWLNHIEAYLGWERMSEGVYWFLAHMNYIGGLGEAAAEAAGDNAADGNTLDDDDDAKSADNATDDTDEADSPRQEKLSAWERLILERTPLTLAERNEGAIDVPWFKRTYAELSDKRWQRLATAARFAANASQAKRATFIADVLLNRISRKTLVDGIKKRQLKDHVRLLGLLPLAKGKKGEADLLERCRILREYRRYANQLSGLTKPAALRSWEIGMRNMAQTAGYVDPLRLEWAVGAEAVKDLSKGPISVAKSGVSVTLALDEMSKPVITVRKGDKELRSIPPAIKKDKKIAALTGRVTELKRQASGIRQSLEAAMCRGDVFTGAELKEWCGHALLAQFLARLVVVGDGILGYPDKQGKALRDHRGKLEPVKAAENLRLAHSHDLLETSSWHDWQRECFQAERVQPFKQVFRELYVVTKQERKDKTVSHRYDGHQVQTKQALALFGQRGWNTQDGIFKVFHDVELTAAVGFDCGITTPAEVEGPSFSGISFLKRGHPKPVPLADVPPRLFSEVMRDLDLVVSVAHAGGVDPEASASTVEMRGNLLRETCLLLKLKNVHFKPSHAIINGDLANYSVHLGSGSVHTMPGGSLCVVPVHAQHRGRLFLPFADDDPRTAEVISKVLLLARDSEIQDPTILEQIRA